MYVDHMELLVKLADGTDLFLYMNNLSSCYLKSYFLNRLWNPFLDLEERDLLKNIKILA